MGNRLISVFELDFDTTGWPLHCGQRMENDHEMRSCPSCNRYIRTGDVIAERDHRSIKRNF